MTQDLDPLETREWLDALDSVVAFDGADRATFLLDELLGGALGFRRLAMELESGGDAGADPPRAHGPHALRDPWRVPDGP